MLYQNEDIKNIKCLFFQLPQLEGCDSQIQTLWGTFSAKVWRFYKKRGRGADQNPNFLRNFCLLDMRMKKKFLKHVHRYKGGGVKAVQQKSKVELLSFLCGFPYQNEDLKKQQIFILQRLHQYEGCDSQWR